MKLAIDLHNVRDGGGVNYISNLLSKFNPQKHGFDAIFVFASQETLDQIPDRLGIEKIADNLLSKSLPFRLFFMLFKLDKAMRKYGCDILYSPGGLYFGRYPFVTISRNMMPFDKALWRGYPMGFDRIRLYLLCRGHASTFSRSAGMIFLTKAARQVISPLMDESKADIKIIPHGVNHELFGRLECDVKVKMAQIPDKTKVIRLVYPSRLEPYKNQLEVIRAVVSLRKKYPNLKLNMCGPANETYHIKVKRLIQQVDPRGDFINYLGTIPNNKLPNLYRKSDVMVFASSCENLPNIMIEGLAFGIPIVSSNSPPMPEVGKEYCTYFDPTLPESIENAVDQTLSGWVESHRRALAGMRDAQSISWDGCADSTFDFIRRNVQ